MRSLGPILLAAGLTLAGTATADDLETRAAQSRDATKALMKELVGIMEGAVRKGGPLSAITTCNEQALPLTQKVAKELSMDIGRTSLKVRNPKNAPDAWETTVMESFAKRKAAGEDPTKLEQYEVVETSGGKEFRYMKAIPLRGVCVVCHGPGIKKNVSDKIYSLYPDDKARGFLPGDIRGAFTLRQAM